MKTDSIDHWNNTPCGSTDIDRSIEQGTLEFFEAVRQSRYEVTDAWMKKHIPFHLGKGKKVLEVGFGMGTDLVTWHLAGAEVHGIDITENHLQLATLNFKTHNLPAHLQIADAANIPYENGFFDVVYSNGVLHHTPDTVRCISECYRVLKPGGTFIFTMYRKYSAYHLICKLLCEGVWHGKLKTLGYKGLLATIEKGADGRAYKPLVKLYTKRQLAIMLSDFAKVDFKVAHLQNHHFGTKLGAICPSFLKNPLEKWLGWYLIAFATK